MFKILVVDDEKSIREVIRTYAEFEGHEVVEAGDGLEAIDKVREEDFDVIVMDIMMPKLDGFSSYKEIKKIKDIPVLMLSARDEEYDKLFGFEIGIDDYVTKPFSPKELMARLNVIVNRNNKIEENNTMEFEGLKIDLDGRVVFVDDEIVELTPKEYDLLVYMVKNKNIALSRDKLLNQVWGYDFYGEDRTVDTHIKMLRNSIKNYRKFIITVRGVGYKFDTRN
ncbi:response regulator transcription factor [Peptoniphilus senegalensis]|uniref:Response regulator transcription factor n=1 Tax=Peptoniphilus senegalensis TaxID=1465757 RepID=A0ABV1IZR6_9FIRM|nr:response regulator transcription factor [Peptoniphilus senegalensis]CAG7584861.1 Alkaline phosphatase synthesis transcriptional regulatory protein PhoP [Peptoniphilus tyrrelliae]